jgi:hypothetical protein
VTCTLANAAQHDLAQRKTGTPEVQLVQTPQADKTRTLDNAHLLQLQFFGTRDNLHRMQNHQILIMNRNFSGKTFSSTKGGVGS